MRPRWRSTFAVVALTVLPALPALDSRSLFSPDETNYAQVAREILETGDLVVPHLDGHVWFNKPPLAYWLLAGAFALLGWGFAAAALLNSALTAATALLVLWHARRASSERAGVLAAAAFLTMALPLQTARTGLTDPALVLCATGAVVAFLAGGRGATMLAGVALGLGLLAKGPVAPLVVLPAMAAAAWQGRRAGGVRRLGVALVCALAVFAPWQLALVARGMWTAWAREFLGYEVLSRATESWRIAAPWWYYLPVLWAGAFPWGTHAVLGARRWLRSGVALAQRRELPELAAVAAPLVAFSLATNKLPHYLLPVFPFLAAWLGRAADRLWDEHARPPWWTTALVALTGGGSLAVLAWLAGHSRATPFLPPATAAVVAGAAGAFVALSLVEGTGRRRAAWLGMGALALLLRLGVDAGLAPYLDGQVPERPLAEAAREVLPPGGVPIAHRWWRTAFVAYGVRGWVQTESAAQLAAAVGAAWGASRGALVLVRSDSEGEARAAAWAGGGELVERARVVGLGEIDGEIIEAIVFTAAQERSGARWFYDADAPAPGEMGLSGVESNTWIASFRWSVQPVARLTVAAAPAGDATLRLRAWGLPDGGWAQAVEVALNSCRLGTLTLGDHPTVHALTAPARCLQTGTQALELHTRHLVIPAERDPASRDGRPLGLAIDWVALDPRIEPRVLVR